MNYISLDLEWNCTKNPKTGKFINEIIEIGAVKLNSKRREVSQFSVVIKPQLTKKLNQYVKRLTHITEQELKGGIPFLQAMKEFSKWAGKNAVFFTWSNTDLYVLLENYKQFLNKDALDFMAGYVDLQRYVEQFVPTKPGQQISLSDAAAALGFDTQNYHLHRALDDSRICAQLLEMTYEQKSFGSMIQPARDESFYKRLTFKPFYIRDFNDANVDKSVLDYKCEKCNAPTNRVSKVSFENNAFCITAQCPECKQRYKINARFKKTFDSVLTSRTVQKLTMKKVRKKTEKTT